MTISLSRSLLLGLSLAAAACGEGLTLPPDGAAANIEVQSGNGQSGRVGSTLLDSLVVRVTDTKDRPVAGANVNFEFTADGSAASPATVSTNADGIAWSRLVLGTRVGTVNGTARVPTDAGVTPVLATFTATVLAGDANGISLVSGDGQSAPVNSALPAPLVVLVTDLDENPISNVTISWSFTGGGSVSQLSTVTDANGQTSVTRTLGPTAGAQTTVATATGLAGSPVTFNHTASAGSAARVIVIDGNGQSAPAGTKLPKELVVQLLDDQNNPISGRPVSWVVGIGGGSASPETSTTDGNGQARTEWTLGPNPGANTLTGVVSGVGNGLFNATGTKVASATTITAHTPEPSIVGTPVTVGVSVSGSGGPPTGQVTVAGDGALAPCTITLANGSGSCAINFAQTGNRDITATYSGDARFSGSSDTQKHLVSPVPNGPPSAAFTAPSCTTGQACQFNDQSSDDGSITAWLWEFGDGESSTLKDPSHTYATAGSKSVKLTVTDNGGLTNSVTHPVTVTTANTPPTAANDQFQTPAGTQLTVNPGEILANDSDPDQSNLTLTAVQVTDAAPADKGAVSGFSSDGSFNFTPSATAVAGDVITFTYKVRDAESAESSPATITITIQ